jgi:hypothetical protein
MSADCPASKELCASMSKARNLEWADLAALIGKLSLAGWLVLSCNRLGLHLPSHILCNELRQNDQRDAAPDALDMIVERHGCSIFGQRGCQKSRAEPEPGWPADGWTTALDPVDHDSSWLRAPSERDLSRRHGAAF